MTSLNLQVQMAAYPQGWVKPSDFSVVEAPMPKPADGEVLVRVLYLSLDPYMRGVMNPGKSYITSAAPGSVMPGGTVGEVVESRNPKFPVGAHVVGNQGWQSYAISDGKGLHIVDAKQAPLPLYLSVLGMPGVTAHIGLLELGRPSPGETVVVSAAAGAVGAVVGQIAKIKGCRAVGIAGGADKCAYAVSELGFDACIDYKAGDLYAQLREATPKNIDVYFENVGGAMLDTVLRRINRGARIPLCGMISQYNLTEPYGVKNLSSLLVNRAEMKGFIISDYLDRWPAAIMELAGWLKAGKLKHREDVAVGLANAPTAFIGMLEGKNFGKQLVKVA